MKRRKTKRGDATYQKQTQNLLKDKYLAQTKGPATANRCWNSYRQQKRSRARETLNHKKQQKYGRDTEQEQSGKTQQFKLTANTNRDLKQQALDKGRGRHMRLVR